MKRISLLLLTLFASSQAFPQAEMADGLRAEGKIYALLAIILLILTGLITYLVIIDRKATRLEKKLDGRNSNPAGSPE